MVSRPSPPDLPIALSTSLTPRKVSLWSDMETVSVHSSRCHLHFTLQQWLICQEHCHPLCDSAVDEFSRVSEVEQVQVPDFPGLPWQLGTKATLSSQRSLFCSLVSEVERLRWREQAGLQDQTMGSQAASCWDLDVPGVREKIPRLL